MSTHLAILESMDVAGFVPDRYAGLRPMVADAIVFFVGHLSPPRLEQILAHQSRLPVGAPRDLRLVTLIRDCPVLQKLAQVIARHPDLDGDLRRRLQGLEMNQPRTPWHELEPLLESALDGAARTFNVEIEPAPLAEASVAVVTPCRWRPSPDAPRRDAVLKILKPGVEDRLEEELEILVTLADHLDEQRDAHDLAAFDHRATFTTVRDLLLNEIRPEMEQQHLAEAAEFYEGQARVHVPAVLPFSTPKVTAMERVFGRRVTDVRREAAPRLAETVIRALVAAPVFAPGGTAMFHADPHAGNLFVTDDDRLALFDWSLVGRLDRPARTAMAAIMLAALRQDADGVADHILAAATHGPVRSDLLDVVSTALGQVRYGRLPGPAWLIELLDAVVARGVHFPADLMLFRKVLLTLRGVVADIDPACSLDAVFLAAGLRTLAEEWPQRFAAHPFSREFATSVSNADLVTAWWSAPASLMSALGRFRSS